MGCERLFYKTYNERYRETVFPLYFRCSDTSIFTHVIYKVCVNSHNTSYQLLWVILHCDAMYEREFSDFPERGGGYEEGTTDRSSVGELRGPKPSICFGPRHVELPTIRLPCIRMQSTRELYSIALGPAVNCYQLRKHPLPFAYHTSLGGMYTYHLMANVVEKRKGRLTHITYP